MEPSVQVALIGFFGVVVTGAIGAIVAVNNKRNEKILTSENTIERTLRERIALRDEQLEDKQEELEDKDAIIQSLYERIGKLQAEKEMLRSIVSELRQQLSNEVIDQVEGNRNE